MVLIPSFIPQVTTRRTPNIVRDLGKGQVTRNDEDKINFDEFVSVQNMTPMEGNLESRNGQEVFKTVANLLTIGIYEKAGGNSLVGSVKTDTDEQKIIDINRTSGDVTDLVTGITSEVRPRFTSLRSFLYYVTGETDLEYYNSSGSGSVAMPEVGEFADWVANDSERIWTFTNLGLLRFSSKDDLGEVSTFTPTGTALNRAGIGNTQISQPTAFTGVDRAVCLASKGRVEFHATPDFNEGNVTTFPSDINTLKTAYDNIGVSSEGGLLAVDRAVFIKPNDDKLYIGALGLSKPEIIDINDGFMRLIDWSDVQMSYDQAKNLLYITGKFNSVSNNVTIVYNVRTGRFGWYSGTAVAKWACDADDNYYMRGYDRKIIRAFKSDVWTDFGSPIRLVIETAKQYAGSTDFWKIARFLFLNVMVTKDITMVVRFFNNEKIRGEATAVWEKSITIKESTNSLGGLPYFSVGILGGSGFLRNEKTTEYINPDILMNIPFYRGHFVVELDVNSKFIFRGIGLTTEMTNRKARTIIMNK